VGFCGLEDSVEDSPRPILHKVLTTEYYKHVDAAVVEHPCPVLQHPFASALVYEVVLEIEDVRVVGRNANVHVDHFGGFDVLSWWLCYLIYVQLWGKRYGLVSFCVGRSLFDGIECFEKNMVCFFIQLCKWESVRTSLSRWVSVEIQRV